jgi:hypothetical protein
VYKRFQQDLLDATDGCEICAAAAASEPDDAAGCLCGWSGLVGDQEATFVVEEDVAVLEVFCPACHEGLEGISAASSSFLPAGTQEASEPGAGAGRSS